MLFGCSFKTAINSETHAILWIQNSRLKEQLKKNIFEGEHRHQKHFIFHFLSRLRWNTNNHKHEWVSNIVILVMYIHRLVLGQCSVSHHFLSSLLSKSSYKGSSHFSFTCCLLPLYDFYLLTLEGLLLLTIEGLYI